MKMLKNSVFDILGVILYRILLDYCYINLQIPIFDSTGFVNDMTITSYIISWVILLLILPFILLNYRKKTISSNVLTLFACVSFIPATSLISFMRVSNEFKMLVFFYWFILFAVNQYMCPVKLILIGGNDVKNTNFLFVFFTVILCLVVVYISGVYANFRLHFGLFDVYDLRFEERDFGLPLPLTYIHSAANVLLPIILVYFLNCKKYILVIVLSFIIFLNFSIGGHKSVLLMLILCFLGYWFYTYNRIRYLSWMLTLLCIFSTAEFYFFNSYISTALFINRTIFIPAKLHIEYYSFFSNRELDYFRQGILRWLGFESPYKDNIAFLIGGEYYGDFENRANSGLFSDAYLNLGALGVFVFPLIIVFILRFLDACSKGLNEKLIILPVLSTGLSLISTTFSTALLTSGLIIMALMLYSLPRESV